MWNVVQKLGEWFTTSPQKDYPRDFNIIYFYTIPLLFEDNINPVFCGVLLNHPVNLLFPSGNYDLQANTILSNWNVRTRKCLMIEQENEMQVSIRRRDLNLDGTARLSYNSRLHSWNRNWIAPPEWLWCHYKSRIHFEFQMEVSSSILNAFRVDRNAWIM